jgi:hypothetical protein
MNPVVLGAGVYIEEESSSYSSSPCWYWSSGNRYRDWLPAARAFAGRNGGSRRQTSDRISSVSRLILRRAGDDGPAGSAITVALGQRFRRFEQGGRPREARRAWIDIRRRRQETGGPNWRCRDVQSLRGIAPAPRSPRSAVIRTLDVHGQDAALGDPSDQPEQALPPQPLADRRKGMTREVVLEVTVGVSDHKRSCGY